MLSKVGKEILIKEVAQAVPNYTMSCFKLPDSICDELTSMVRDFWWGQKNEETKMAWVSWGKLCVPKSQGGLGFKLLKEFNLALLAKQGWKLQTESNFLAHQVLKAKYFPESDFVNASLGRRPSYLWRSIMAAQHIVRSGLSLSWRVSNGHNIQIWLDKWLPTPSTFKVSSPKNLLEDHAQVSELIDCENGLWKAELVESVFLPYEAETILGIPISAALPEDSVI